MLSEQEARILADEIIATGQGVIGVSRSRGRWCVDIGKGMVLLQFFSRAEWLAWLEAKDAE